MVVLLIGMLGSTLGILSVMDYNYRNALRNDAVKIAQEELEKCRNIRYEDLMDGSVSLPDVVRRFRKGSQTFHVTRTVEASTYLKMTTIVVQWTYKNKPYTYSVASIVKRPQ